MKFKVVPTPLGKSAPNPDEWEQTIRTLGDQVRREGHLVVIPTETVYGLGANALDRNAALRIFEAKQRPLTDPLICHVSCFNEAKLLYCCKENELIVIEALSQTFWPGPLSIVARASEVVPKEVTGFTGNVAVRFPNHPIAIALIKAARVPIAAPSANRFGYISASCPDHVLKNFSPEIQLRDNVTTQESILILDAGETNIGIESTVCQVKQNVEENNIINITIFRRGRITSSQIREALMDSKVIKDKAVQWGLQTTDLPKETHLGNNNVSNKSQMTFKTGGDNASFDSSLEQPYENSTSLAPSSAPENPIFLHPCTNDTCSPGILVKHYSPSIPTFLFKVQNKISLSTMKVFLILNSKKIPLKQCVLLDPYGSFRIFQHMVAVYFSLIESNVTNSIEQECCHSKEHSCPHMDSDWIEATRTNFTESKNLYGKLDHFTAEIMQKNLFKQLHKAEDFALKQKLQLILIGDDLGQLITEETVEREAFLSVYDRLFRAASGRTIPFFTEAVKTPVPRTIQGEA